MVRSQCNATGHDHAFASSTMSPTQALLSSPTTILISQGAEAKVYKTQLTPGDDPVLLKYRFSKGYRHPILDGNLTRSRVTGEARALLRCLKCGVNAPAVRFVDLTEGVIGIEWIDGMSVRKILGGGADDESLDDQDLDDGDTEERLSKFGLTMDALMGLIGSQLAKMHLADIIHGDLTTSNMMLRSSPTSSASPALHSELILIDFGLSYVSSLVEDKAVDLYVLERAFASTHPDSEPLFTGVLKAYEEGVGKDWKAISKRLDEVRLRGRKRSMVG
ncbi:kinase-like domain-containing protein [Flagelloscypha sp. PMI_526]|nr:kinase-like domain-containing protein [Flagelloscypha sp. PMI_526]